MDPVDVWFPYRSVRLVLSEDKHLEDTGFFSSPDIFLACTPMRRMGNRWWGGGGVTGPPETARLVPVLCGGLGGRVDGSAPTDNTWHYPMCPWEPPLPTDPNTYHMMFLKASSSLVCLVWGWEIRAAVRTNLQVHVVHHHVHYMVVIFEEDDHPIHTVSSVTCFCCGETLTDATLTIPCGTRGKIENATGWTRRRPGQERKLISGPTSVTSPMWSHSNISFASSQPSIATYQWWWTTSRGYE